MCEIPDLVKTIKAINSWSFGVQIFLLFLFNGFFFPLFIRFCILFMYVRVNLLSAVTFFADSQQVDALLLGNKVK